MTRTASTRVREDEQGFTLVELLIGMTLAMGLVLGAFMAADAGNRLAFGTTNRIDALNRGRDAMEVISRDIRSQQCLNSTTRPMVAANETSMTFYGSVAPGPAPTSTTPNAQQPVQKRVIEALPDTSGDQTKIDSAATQYDIWEKVWTGTTDANGNTTFAANYDSRRRIAHDVEVAPDRRNKAVNAPFFRYFKYASATGSGRVDYTSPVNLVGGNVVAADLAGIVVIEVSFKISQSGTKAGSGRKVATNLYNTVSVRIADPTNPGGSPQCL